MIIDVHTHCPPGGGEDGFSLFRNQCRRSGVALALVSSLGRWNAFPDAAEVRQANDEARAFALRSEGLMQWLAYLNPQNENWWEELERCRAGGAIGVKLWISLKDAHGGLENAAAVIERAAQLRLPVLIHTYQRTGPNLPGEITLEELADLAERHPAAGLIGAHAGGNWRQGIGVLRGRARHVCVDLSGSFPERGMVEALVRDIGAERVLFGSDAPGRSIASQLAKVLLADIAPQDKELILSGNALRVFGPGLRPAPVPPPGPLRPDSQLPDLRAEHFCFCGQWPVFATPCGAPGELEHLLSVQGIERAYVGELGGIYRMDLEQANDEFLRAAAGLERVAPLAALNPRAHNWRQTIQDLKPGGAGAILHPYLHDWRLDEPRHGEFFRRCAERGIRLWITCAFGDDRFRHCGLAARPVAKDEMVQFARTAPANSYVFQGVTAEAMEAFLNEFPGDERFRFELSRLTDFSGALERVTARHGVSRLVMGSEFPLRDIREVRWAARRV